MGLHNFKEILNKIGVKYTEPNSDDGRKIIQIGIVSVEFTGTEYYIRTLIGEEKGIRPDRITGDVLW